MIQCMPIRLFKLLIVRITFRSRRKLSKMFISLCYFGQSLTIVNSIGIYWRDFFLAWGLKTHLGELV